MVAVCYSQPATRGRPRMARFAPAIHRLRIARSPNTVRTCAQRQLARSGPPGSRLGSAGTIYSGLARVAGRLEATWGGGVAATARERTCALLSQQRGVGPWTIGYLRGSALGDSDAVVLGDYGFPRQVAYFFTGQPQEATDDDMLRLLQPYRPHRFYVLALLLKSGLRPPRRGPRRARLRDRLRAHQREQ